MPAKEDKDLPSSGPIIWDRHEPLYPSTTAVSNDYNILHLKHILLLTPVSQEKTK